MLGKRTAALAMYVVLCSSLYAADVSVQGRVVDENDAPVYGAHIQLRASDSSKTWETQTDPTGAFAITLPHADALLISVEREGYYALTDQAIRIDPPRELALVINSIREVFQSENVNAQTSPIDVGQTQNEEHLSGTQVNDIPFPNSHSLRNSLELLPGVLQDLSGALHVNGGAENQVLYLFNGFNISSPLSGQFQTLFPVEGIRSIDLSSGQSSSEFGKGSAGVMRINTESGTDRFHYTATDFVPGIDINQGIRLGNWYPRVGVSGPIERGRAWFADTFESELTQTVITGLPQGQNTRGGWAGSNVLHGQMNLTASNIVFADFLVNISNQRDVGLGTLSPLQTTYSVDTRQYFASVKDQQYFGHGMLMELGYAHNAVSASSIPKGDSLYVISPQGASGNYYLHSQQRATRDQAIMRVFIPKLHFMGEHQLEAGTDIDWLHYDADLHRTGYQVLGVSGQLLSETLFGGPAVFKVSDSEQSAYLFDTWRIRKGLQWTAGFRADRDGRIGSTGLSPRIAFSWSPTEASKTKISGGYSITHDAVTLQMLGQPFDQSPNTTNYNADGTPAGPSASATFAIGHSALALPRATNWTFNIDQQLLPRLFVAANYLRRRGTEGFLFLNTLDPGAPPSLLPLPNPQAAALYQLTNLRRDDYDSASISIRQTLSGQYAWMASYTRSRSESNAVIDPNSAVPLQLLPSFVPTQWNAPNRLLAHGYAPLPWKNWAFSVLTDLRNGFPFSVRDQTGLIIGGVNSHHYPLNFDLNLAIERMITLRGYRFALRGGVDNLTNQPNPTAVNRVLGESQFLQFLGDEGRHYVVRIRFFGRSKK